MSDEETDVTMEGAVKEEELVDAPMEETKTEVVDVSDVVHEWMKNKLPNEEIERANMHVPSDVSTTRFIAKWSQAYPSVWESVSDADHNVLYAVVKTHLGRGAEGSDRISTSPTDKELDALERAFTAAFVGDAHVRLFQYIELCWKRYVTQGQRFCYPYIAIVQSSGFGKSRVLRECARVGHEINRTTPNNERFHLMYVCARNIPGSTGFPVETARLREHLFPRIDEDKPTDTLVDAMSKKLVQLFDFVMQAPDPSIVDEQLFQLFTRKPEAQDPFCKPPSGSPLHRRKSDEKTRVLVIAIDEARALLPTQPDAVNIGWFRCFRRALYQANDVLGTAYGDRSGIFGIVVDTNSRVSDFVPSARLDPSKRATDRVLFPPFVLTDTVDVFYKVKLRPPTELVRFYRDRVLAAVANAASRNKSTDPTSWKDLRKLGRPLWGSRMWKHRDLITLAAEKLLGGGSTLSERALTDGIGAVASVMCRLGIRPYMSTPLATQVVADYMAVLSYVSCEREHFFVSYSSDPILTLGAARLWHFGVDSAGSSSNLSRYILPQLKVILRQEVLDTGGIGEFVARIVLLLAMDACAVLETDNEDMRWLGGGEFYRVPTFLQALAGTSVEVHQQRGMDATTMADVDKAMETRWADYFVSFTHFVQLSEEPNETCLWGLLGRRAAAMLPRGQRGADFIIPICLRKREKTSSTSRPLVSMILVQVKNHERGYSSFIQAVTKKMDPEFVFSEANPLRDTAPGNVLRVLMSLREPRPRHAYVEDPREPGSYALCIFGLQTWSSLLRKRAAGKAVEVLSPAVASELSEMLGPWWRVAEMVKVDMEKYAGDRRIESDSALLLTALHPLGDVLVLNQCLPTTGES